MTSEKRSVRASVHEVVEAALLSGDLLPAATAKRLLEGIAGHRSLQSVPDPEAQNEVPVSLTCEGERVRLTVSGRIDRLYGNGVLEEIKTVRDEAPPEPLTLHLAQAECYAFMYCQSEGLPGIEVRVTYLNLDAGEISRHSRCYTVQTLRERFEGYVRPYLNRLDTREAHRERLAEQMRALAFPFPAYRAGQRELAAEVYRTIRDRRMLLAQAPTGTGKTLAVLFPALKGIGEGLTDRIFYLTARSTTRRAACDALSLLPESALRTLVLYARDKLCPYETRLCRTGNCPRAVGYYDRLPEALSEASRPGLFDREAVCTLADAHTLCPFEFSLDLSEECDVVVCDYNYFFDPKVRLQRYRSGGRSGQVLLVDEAHNLPDRARSMYSALLDGGKIDRMRRSVPAPRRKGVLYGVLRELCRALREAYLEAEAPRWERTLREEINLLCEQALEALQESEDGDPALRAELLPELYDWVFRARQTDESYRLLFEGSKTSPRVTLLCTDASSRIGKVLSQSRAAVLFSATLTPPEFYRTLCGLPQDSACVRLLSPFPPENLLVLHLPVSTRYRHREQTLPRIAEAAAAFVLSRKAGNFLLFFPSYVYLQRARELLEPLLDGQAEMLVQTPEMAEEAREEFLSRFSPDPSGRLAALCVMGGLFSEGIDLPADRLCGAAVIGVGLPQTGPERDALRESYQERYGDGYDYAYVYPGLNRVLQAAGRVIRSESDRGALLLVDDRYAQSPYPALLPPHWTLRCVHGASQISSVLSAFWAEKRP